MLKWGFSVTTAFLLYACDSYHQRGLQDPSSQLTEEENLKDISFISASSPLLQPKTASPDPVPKEFFKKISISTTDAITLKDLFLSIAQQAKINLVLAPDVKGTAVVHVQNRPLIDLLQELCDSHGLRLKIAHRIIKIEIDRPYLHSYPLEFLTLARSNVNRFSITTDVFTGSEGSQGDEDNSSSTILTTEAKTDFWQELTENLNMLLSIGSPGPTAESAPSRYSLHKQAGLISVFANHSQHQQIKSYLKILRQNIDSQVLIEAKIVEVHLKEECKSGINWDVVKKNFVLQAPLGPLVIPGPFNKETPPQRNVFTFGGGNKDITCLINLLNRFGTVRTLSNPRLTVMNNQSAVLKIATNKVYFKLNYTCDYNYFDKREQTYVSSDARTVPIGLVMAVQPSISHNDRKIILTLRPTISRVIQEVLDPAVGIASHQKQTSFVPEVQVRELDSVLAMNSGETIIVGGLMEERTDQDTSQVRGVSAIPLLGALFEGHNHEQQVTELVIFLRATIVY